MKHTILLKTIFIFSLHFCVLLAMSQEKAIEQKKKKLLALPVIFSSPETSLGAGFTAMYYFRTDTSSNTNPSSIRANAIYTLEKQLLLELPVTIFTKNNLNWINGEVAYFIYPYQYYGQGSSISLKNFDSYDATFMRVNFDAFRKIGNSLYAGPRMRYVQYFDIGRTSSNGIITNELIGFSKNNIMGFGLGMIQDKRNNVFAANDGYFLSVGLMGYQKWFGSDFNYQEVSFDGRKFFAPTPKSELGFQFFHQSQIGRPPFYALSSLGGSRLMRGYYSGAFRDKHYTAVQSEFRFYALKKVLLASFISFGSVTETLANYEKVIAAGGVGIRYEVDSKEKIRLRMDIAFGKESSGLYLGINETF